MTINSISIFSLARVKKEFKINEARKELMSIYSELVSLRNEIQKLKKITIDHRNKNGTFDLNGFDIAVTDKTGMSLIQLEVKIGKTKMHAYDALEFYDKLTNKNSHSVDMLKDEVINGIKVDVKDKCKKLKNELQKLKFGE